MDSGAVVGVRFQDFRRELSLLERERGEAVLSVEKEKSPVLQEVGKTWRTLWRQRSQGREEKKGTVRVCKRGQLAYLERTSIEIKEKKGEHRCPLGGKKGIALKLGEKAYFREREGGGATHLIGKIEGGEKFSFYLTEGGGRRNRDRGEGKRCRDGQGEWKETLFHRKRKLRAEKV